MDVDLSVERKSRPARRNAGAPTARANSKRCVTSCSATHVRNSIRGRAPSPARTRDVRHDEEQRAPGRVAGHGQVVLPEHALREEPEHRARPASPSAAGRAASPARPSVLRLGAGIPSRHRAPERLARSRARRGLEQAARARDVRLTHSARRTASTCDTSAGAARPVKSATGELRGPNGLRPARALLLGGLGIAPRPTTAEAMPTCRASSQFTGPVEDAITRWSSRKSGASRGIAGVPAEREPYPAGPLMPASLRPSRYNGPPCRPTGTLVRVTAEPLDPRRSVGVRRRPRRRRDLLFSGPFATTRTPARWSRASSTRPGRSARPSGSRRSATRCSRSGPSCRVALLHRIGGLDGGRGLRPGRCSAPHRAEAFEAGRHGIERIKQDVPIWKKEGLVSGEAHWVMGSSGWRPGHRPRHREHARVPAGRGIVYDEPTVVAVNARDRPRVAIGDDVAGACSAAPGNVIVVRPLDAA